MASLVHELKRLFGAGRDGSARGGVTGGDPALLELLDLPLLLQEARSADVAAARVGAKDTARRRLDAAVVWREAARRTGDPVHLRKAAANAEMAATGFDRARRSEPWARARCEQAFCALLGAELFADHGLNAAAEVAFKEARALVRGGLTAALADTGLAVLAGRAELATGDAQAARRAYERFTRPIAALDVLARRENLARVLAAEARLMRADLICAWGARLADPALLRLAVDEAAAAGRRVDAAYEPLSSIRAEIVRAQALTLWGETCGELEALTAAATVAEAALGEMARDHSPLDWARAQMALGQALQSLGEGTLDERAFEQAVTAYERAQVVLKDCPTAALRAQCAGARALSLTRSAELTGDLAVLDAAEAAMKIELSNLHAGRDPVAWALAQLHLARLYEARIGITGRDDGRRAGAGFALDAALEVFAEQGLRSLAVIATEGLERLRSAPRTAV